MPTVIPAVKVSVTKTPAVIAKADPELQRDFKKNRWIWRAVRIGSAPNLKGLPTRRSRPPAFSRPAG
jgi:hypothetical protein